PGSRARQQHNSEAESEGEVKDGNQQDKAAALRRDREAEQSRGQNEKVSKVAECDGAAVDASDDDVFRHPVQRGKSDVESACGLRAESGESARRRSTPRQKFLGKKSEGDAGHAHGGRTGHHQCPCSHRVCPGGTWRRWYE